MHSDAVEYYKQQYEDLTQKLKQDLPIKAFPSRELVQALGKQKKTNLTASTELIIQDVYNSGDISGIMCVVGHNTVCGLTHLLFAPNHPLYQEIREYQKKRNNRIQKLNQMQ